MRNFIYMGLMCAIFLVFSSAYGDEKPCEIKRPIVFGGLDWESAQFHNAVAGYILEKGYHCKTDQIPGSSTPILAGLIRGDIDVMLEVWVANIPEAWEKALKKGKVLQLGPNFEEAVQGFFVPRYLVEGDKKRGIEPLAPDLKSVTDLLKYKHLFKDPENPKKGLFHNCIFGWHCETVNNKKLAAYGLDKEFTNLKPGTGAALDAAIASHYKKGKPFVTYYWSPTWIMGTFDLIQLKEPAFNQAKWDAFNNGDHAKVTEYPPTIVYKGLNAKFAKKAKRLTKFFENYKTSTAITNEALAFLRKKRGLKSRDAAIYFLKNHKQVWQGWVPSEIVPKIELALKGEKNAI